MMIGKGVDELREIALAQNEVKYIIIIIIIITQLIC
jgi:hypothetical protein